MKKICAVLFTLINLSIALAQTRTIGVTEYKAGNEDGYILFTPIVGKTTFLIDKCGREINRWTSNYRPWLSAKLLPDGGIMRAGIVSAGNTIFERMDWNGNVQWSYAISDPKMIQHHDFTVMPNGHILAILWDIKTPAEAIDKGRNPITLSNEFRCEKIIEIEPVGSNDANIVWEWNLWDHTIQEFDINKADYGVVADHAELVDINYVDATTQFTDWIHMNAVEYNETLDQIMLSTHNLNEVWIIDHSTTTQEAAGHTGGNQGKGGDLLWRWGNPRAYDRGNAASQVFFGQHNAHWINDTLPNAGKILVFNNGEGRADGDYSTIDMLTVDNNYPKDANGRFLPASLTYQYKPAISDSFYSEILSGAEALDNGGFIACLGVGGKFIEIDANDSIVWSYRNPVNNAGSIQQGTIPVNNNVFRAYFYNPNYPGLLLHDLTPGAELELNPLDTALCDLIIIDTTDTTTIGIPTITADKIFTFYPNPANDNITIIADGLQAPEFLATLVNPLGQVIWQRQLNGNKNTIAFGNIASGIYLLQLQNNTYKHTLRVVKQ